MSDPIATPTDLANMIQGSVDTATATLLIELAQGLAEDIVSPLPPSAKAVVLSAAKRAYSNPEGLTTETIGPYATGRTTGDVFLTRAEERALKRAAGRGGAYSIDPTPCDAGAEIAIENAEEWLSTYPSGVFGSESDAGLDDSEAAIGGSTVGGAFGFDLEDPYDWPWS